MTFSVATRVKSEEREKEKEPGKSTAQPLMSVASEAEHRMRYLMKASEEGT